MICSRGVFGISNYGKDKKGFYFFVRCNIFGFFLGYIWECCGVVIWVFEDGI